MITERDFLSEMGGIILRVFQGNDKFFTKEKVCQDGHFSPKMFLPERILCMRGSTLLRLMLYFASAMSRDELDEIFLALSHRIYEVADDEDFSAYRIIDSHAGSPIKSARHPKNER